VLCICSMVHRQYSAAEAKQLQAQLDKLNVRHNLALEIIGEKEDELEDLQSEFEHAKQVRIRDIARVYIYIYMGEGEGDRQRDRETGTDTVY
jgi:TATA element modulatory factor 1 TATA binding